MADLAPDLFRLATCTGQLTGRQIKMIGGALAEVDRLERRKAALLGAWRLLWPEVAADRWRLAGVLSVRLRRIQCGRRRLILAGHRIADPLERELLELLDCGGPESLERIHDELKELTEPRQ